MSKPPKLRVLKPSVRMLGPTIRPAPSRSEQRVWGRWSQARRLRMWTASPYCVDCGKLTDFPNGFDLDHEIPVEDGGSEDDSNLRVRCVWWEHGKKCGCHAEKTAREKLAAGR